MLIGWVTAIVAIGSVFVGFNGILNGARQHDWFTEVKFCLKEMPKPVYINDLYASMPWINPSKMPIAPSWNYEVERRKGVPFEHGGIGGLIDTGYFASLLLPKSIKDVDGSSFQRYRNTNDECAGYDIYIKIP